MIKNVQLIIMFLVWHNACMRSSVYAINRKTLSAFRSEQNDQDSHHNLQKHEYIRLIAAAEWSNDDDKEFFSQDRNNRLNRGARYSSKLIPSTSGSEPHHHQHQNDPFVRYTVETPDMHRVINPLMKQANTASIALLFVLLIWRTFSCFEMAEQILSAHTKALLLVPATILTCANAIGFFVNLLKPMGFKNHLKVILALNLIREGIEMLFNVMMMIFSDSRELFFGRFFVNCWWFFLCYSFSKSRWVLETSIPTNRYEFYDSPPQPQASSAYSRRR